MTERNQKIGNKQLMCASATTCTFVTTVSVVIGDVMTRLRVSIVIYVLFRFDVIRRRFKTTVYFC